MLVDDILSELDDIRKEKLLDNLNSGNQIIFTMLKSHFFNQKKADDSRIFEITDRGITRDL